MCFKAKSTLQIKHGVERISILIPTFKQRSIFFEQREKSFEKLGNHSIQCDEILPKSAINYESLITLSMNSQCLSFVPAVETTNDYLSDIVVQDFTAD